MQLLSHSAADYEQTSVVRKVVDVFDRGLAVSPSIDCYSLQAIVRNALKTSPNGDVLAVQLSKPKSGLPDNFQAPAPCEITVYSDGEIVCVLEPFIHLSLVFESRDRGRERVRGVVQLSLRGTPNQQISGSYNALQQMAHMHAILALKLTAGFDGCICRDAQDVAGKIAGMVLEARSEFKDQFNINTVSAWLSVWKSDQTHKGSAERDSIQYEAESKISSPAENTDYIRVPTSSADSSMREDVAAIKALLQELDSKPLSITSTSLDDAIASDKATRSVQLESNAKSKGQMQRGVVVALGSNVGNRIEEIEKACHAIDADPNMRIVDTSFLYETKPMYVEDQERFVNGACEAS